MAVTAFWGRVLITILLSLCNSVEGNARDLLHRAGVVAVPVRDGV